MDTPCLYRVTFAVHNSILKAVKTSNTLPVCYLVVASNQNLRSHDNIRLQCAHISNCIYAVQSVIWSVAVVVQSILQVTIAEFMQSVTRALAVVPQRKAPSSARSRARAIAFSCNLAACLSSICASNAALDGHDEPCDMSQPVIISHSLVRNW
jgi:hypothetical protein